MYIRYVYNIYIIGLYSLEVSIVNRMIPCGLFSHVCKLPCLPKENPPFLIAPSDQFYPVIPLDRIPIFFCINLPLLSSGTPVPPAPFSHFPYWTISTRLFSLSVTESPSLILLQAFISLVLHLLLLFIYYLFMYLYNSTVWLSLDVFLWRFLNLGTNPAQPNNSLSILFTGAC